MPVPPLGKAPASRRRRRLWSFDHLEPRQLLTAYVQVNQYRADPGETTITRSDSVTATDPSFGHTSTIAWSATATVSNATVGNPVGITFAIQTDTASSVRFPSGPWYPYVGGTSATGRAEWSDTFVVAHAPILEQSPYVTLTFQAVANFTANPEPLVANPGHSATNNYAQIDVTGSRSHYQSALGGDELPDTFTANIPVTRGSDGHWHGSWQVEAAAGVGASVGRGPMQESHNSTASGTFISTVTSAAFADGSTPDFSPEKPDIVSKGLQWNSEGFTYQYEVKGADLTEDVPIGFFWSPDGSLPATNRVPALSISTHYANRSVSTQHEITVRGREMLAPGPRDRYLIAVADPDGQLAEASETNNQSTRGIVTTSPSVELMSTPDSLLMGERFTLIARVMNISPMPLNFSLTLDELASRSNPMTVGPPLVGDLRYHRVEGAFYPSAYRDIVLVETTRTWPWISPENPVTTLTSFFADQIASAISGAPNPSGPPSIGKELQDETEFGAAEKAVELLRAGAGEIVSALATLKDALEVLEAALHTPTNVAAFRVTADTTGVTPEDPDRIPLTPGSATLDVTMDVGDERRTYFKNYVGAIIASKVALSGAVYSVGLLQPLAALGFLAAMEGSLQLAHYYYDLALGVQTSNAPPPVTKPLKALDPAKIPASLQFIGPRSAAKQVVLPLGRKATVAPGAFELRAKGGKMVRLKVTQSQDASGTSVTLRPRGSTKSLANGVYTLKIRGEGLTDGFGRSFDADGDGVEGGSRVQRFRLVKGRIRLL